jgi:hypothetical protein
MSLPPARTSTSFSGAFTDFSQELPFLDCAFSSRALLADSVQNRDHNGRSESPRVKKCSVAIAVLHWLLAKVNRCSGRTVRSRSERVAPQAATAAPSASAAAYKRPAGWSCARETGVATLPLRP